MPWLPHLANAGSAEHISEALALLNLPDAQLADWPTDALQHFLRSNCQNQIASGLGKIRHLSQICLANALRCLANINMRDAVSIFKLSHRHFTSCIVGLTGYSINFGVGHAKAQHFRCLLKRVPGKGLVELCVVNDDAATVDQFLFAASRKCLGAGASLKDYNAVLCLEARTLGR